MRKLKLLLALCMVTIAASASKTVYLAPGTWNVGGERYALCLLSDPQVWVNFTDADGDGVYTATFDDSSCTQMVICRMNGSSTENRWNNDGETGDDRPMWNQTQNIDISVIDGLTYTINNWSDDNGKSGYSTSGDTYLYNVGANAYLQNGANWGTHAIVNNTGFKVDVNMSNGKYTISTNSTYSGKFFGTNGYVDNGDGEDRDWAFEPVEGQSAFKLKTSSSKNSGDYAYVGSGKCYVILDKDPGSNMGWWRLVTDTKRNDVSTATNLTPVELTHKINNSNFSVNNNGWNDAPSRGGNDANDTNLNPCVEQYNKTYDTYQTISNLPNGTYAVSVQGFYREGGYVAAASKHVAGTESLNAVFYANSEEQPLMSIFEEAGKASGGSTKTADGINGAFPDDRAAASYFFTAGLYVNTIYVTVTDGTLKIGIKKSTAVNADWTPFDNFRIQYFGNCSITEAKNGALILAYNEALETARTLAGKAMEASAKSTLNGVIDANDDLDTTTATAEQLTAATTALDEAVLAAQPSADLYATIRSLLDGLKVQDAEFDRETKYNDGEYTAISEVYNEYYAFATNKLGTSANTDFTNAIVNPSFEFGNTLGWAYDPISGTEQGAKNYVMTGKDGTYLFNIWSTGHAIKQTITNLPKGLYELKAVVANNGAKVYLVANGVTEGIQCNDNADEGVEGSVKAVVGDNGVLTIGASGCNNDDERSYSEVGVWWYKADNFRLTYLGDVVSDEDAAALLATVPTGKMNAEVETALNDAKTAFEASKTTDNYSALQTAIENANVSVTAYAAAKSAIDEAKDIQENNNVVTAAAATTFAEAIAAIETPYNNGTLSTNDANNAGTVLGVSASGWHGNANGAAGKYMESAWDMPGNFQGYYINTWSTEGNSDGSNFKVPFVEYWTDQASLGAKTMTATQENLTPNGIYTVSVWARVSGNDKVANSITLQVGEGSTTDITAGTQIGSSNRYLDTFTATGRADGSGTLTIKINVAAESNVSWLSFKNVKYTEVESASSEDYAALAAAITAAEANTLGFEAGEYAPYNNVAALEALIAAKAIDVNAVNAKEDVEAAIAAIAADKWTANTEEVNAVFDGSFENDYSSQTGNVNPLGWQRVKNAAADGYNVRYMNGSNAGLAATSSGKALFTKQSAYYGYADGYTMPLKANTWYMVSFVYAGWGDCKKDGYVSVSAPDGSAVELSVSELPLDAVDGDSNKDSWKSYSAMFKTGDAGEYVLGLRKKNYDTSGQSQYAYGDIMLKKANIYAVVGSGSFFSDSWNQATQDDILMLENGVYTKTYADQELDKQTIEYKFIKKASVEAGEATEWYSNNGNDNSNISIPVKGKYDITFTFDGTTVTGVATKTAEAVTIGEKGWATTVTNSPLDFSNSEVEAYTATVSEDKTTVSLTKVDNVQAETGLVLKGAKEAKTYYIPVAESSSTEKGSLMHSSTASYNIWQPTDGTVNTFYGLTVNKYSEAQFVKINAENGYALPAQKAFLMINRPAGQEARTLTVVFGEATGIDAVVAEKNVEGIYNMNGQRVTAPAKGLYIVNGKKVVLK